MNHCTQCNRAFEPDNPIASTVKLCLQSRLQRPAHHRALTDAAADLAELLATGGTYHA